MNYGPSARPDRSRDPRLGSGRGAPVGGGRPGRFEGGPVPQRDPRFDGPESFDNDDDLDGPDVGPGAGPGAAIDVAEVRGLSRARDRLLPWFRKIVDSVEEEQNPLRVTLSQRVAQGGLQAITTVEYNLETESPPDETINQLLQLAAEDILEARFVGNKLNYALTVLLSNGDTSLQNFLLEIPRPRGTAFAEPPRAQHFPDVTGTIGHLLDRDLQLTQLAVEGGSRGVDLLERDIERKTEEIRELKEENRKLRASEIERSWEMQKLIDGNMKRQMMMDEHRSKVERDAAIGEGFKAIMPHLVPFLLPANMASAVTPALAMMNAQRAPQQSDAGDEGGGHTGASEGQTMHDPSAVGVGASPDMPMVPGLVNDTALIDELIREFEEDQGFFMKLFTLMGEKPRCAQLLAMIYEASRVRQQRRAQMQAATSGRVRPST